MEAYRDIDKASQFGSGGPLPAMQRLNMEAVAEAPHIPLVDWCILWAN